MEAYFAMYRIKTFNKISPVGLNRLEPEHYTVATLRREEDGILVRSAKLLDYAFPENLLAIARAGAGVNNIPLDRCSEQGIVVFNTPGANANAVKELVLCAMLMGSRDVGGSIQWVRKQVAAGVDVTTVVEKGKAAFIGPELYKRPWASSAWAPSAPWWPTSHCPWAWTCTATTPSCRWMQLCGWTGTSMW